MKTLALTLPGGQTINAPGSLPHGGIDTLSGTLSNAMTLLIIFAVVAVLIVIIWAGAQWITSGGDKAKLAAARARLTWAIIGLIVVFLSFLIVSTVGYFFGVSLIK